MPETSTTVAEAHRRNVLYLPPSDIDRVPPGDLIGSLIRRIENVEHLRPGMMRTPERISQSWTELFSGYNWHKEDIERMLTTFDGEEYDEMVILDNIEFYSTCEHHWLPFSGVAHVAYI